MKQKVLVLGGSYFIGRVFCIMAEKSGEFELTVLNRGRFPLKRQGVTEIKFDRSRLRETGGADNPTGLDFSALLPAGGQFDALVDFCAYEPGDCSSITNFFAGKIRRYIELSSCSVFAPSGTPRTEESPKIAPFAGSGSGGKPEEEYAAKKALLETELAASCGKLNIPCTIMRPSFVYGPFNYAPRESWYFDQLLKGEKIPLPDDSSSSFSFVYVKDIAKALMARIKKGGDSSDSYNLAGSEPVTYASLTSLICSFVPGAAAVNVSVSGVYERNIPLPFPLEQNDLYSGEKAAVDLQLTYTPFETGMRETFDVFKASRG